MQTMFVRNITQVDFAYVNHDGAIIGDSVNLNANVTGSVDDAEQVVIDFGACKKQIKHIIDDTDLGMDHKLVVFNGWSNYSSQVQRDSKFVVDTHQVCVTAESSRNVTEIDWVGTYELSLVNYLNNMLSAQLSELHGREVIVECDLNHILAMPPFVKTFATFSYAHGLKNSSSYGCQNIAHGHFSYVGVDVMDFTANAQIVMNNIAKYFHEALLINVNDVSDGVLAYTGMTRGKFSLDLKRKQHKVIYMDTDTTVENIVKFVYSLFEQDLKDIGATKLWVSEGLSKGAVVEVK